MNKIKNKCYVIAEAGLNHNGSIDIAKKLIDLAVLGGSDAVKFQKRTVDLLAVSETLNAVDDRFPEFGKTYKEIREHLEFDRDQYIELRDYARGKGIDFIVTAFDTEAVDFLLDIDVNHFKLASHSLTNIELLEYLSKKQKRTILSTGMATLGEIDTAVNIFKKNNASLELMHCVSAYPTPENECNLNMMLNLKKMYGLPTGYSGHELGFFPTLTAVSMGAELIERHYTLDNDMVGFDHKMSLGPEEFISMMKNIRKIEEIKGNGVKTVSDTEMITKKKYHVSIASSQDIEIGSILLESMITYRNPGTGIPAKDLKKILGKKVNKKIPADILLTFDMFE